MRRLRWKQTAIMHASKLHIRWNQYQEVDGLLQQMLNSKWRICRRINLIFHKKIILTPLGQRLFSSNSAEL